MFNNLPTTFTQAGYDYNAATDAAPLSLTNYKVPSLRGFDSNSWVKKAAKFSNYGLAPTESTTVDSGSNQSIIFTRAIYPWVDDNTHFQLQPGMLVFNIRNDNSTLYCTAPIYKINEILRKDYDETKNTFISNIKLAANNLYGEEYFYSDAGSKTPYFTQENFKYTKRGIMETCLFDGCVESKSESTEPFASYDNHESTDMVTSAGIIVAKQARVSNIWGNVRPGDKLYLVLIKTEAGAYQFVPYKSKSQYPRTTYTDQFGRTQPAGVIYIGTCTEVREKDPNPTTAYTAYSSISSLKSFEAYGCLPFIQVQLRL
jgi:hypothetical protein